MGGGRVARTVHVLRYMGNTAARRSASAAMPERPVELRRRA